MKFEYARPEERSDERFIAFWAVWFAGKDSDGLVDAEGPVPRLARNCRLQTLIDNNCGHGLDALCRIFVGRPDIDTSQARSTFCRENDRLLMDVKCDNPIEGGRKGIKGARLTAEGLRLLDKVRKDESLLREAEAIIQADIDAEPRRGKILPVTNRSVRPGNVEVRLDGLNVQSKRELVAAFCDDVQQREFRPEYRKVPFGRSVVGWSERLKAYFWPRREWDYKRTTEEIAPLLSEAKSIAELPRGRPWDEATSEVALNFAHKVFKWGGVPQPKATADDVHKVASAALDGLVKGAPMNSGWTKIAAFLTSHLEGEDRSQAIWDSRVSYSLVRGMDRILNSSGYRSVPNWLDGLGEVPGRGGHRWSVQRNLKWRGAYGRWESHLAASKLIREIRDELNRRGEPAPQPDGAHAPWTVRTVEMVLFMDGY